MYVQLPVPSNSTAWTTMPIRIRHHEDDGRKPLSLDGYVEMSLSYSTVTYFLESSTTRSSISVADSVRGPGVNSVTDTVWRPGLNLEKSMLIWKPLFGHGGVGRYMGKAAHTSGLGTLYSSSAMGLPSTRSSSLGVFSPGSTKAQPITSVFPLTCALFAGSSMYPRAGLLAAFVPPASASTNVAISSILRALMRMFSFIATLPDSNSSPC